MCTRKGTAGSNPALSASIPDSFCGSSQLVVGTRGKIRERTRLEAADGNFGRIDSRRFIADAALIAVTARDRDNVED